MLGMIHICWCEFTLLLLERFGLYHYSHIIPGRTSARSLSQFQALYKLHFDTFQVPNISGFYHGIMRDLWEDYGLGQKGLLISESTRTRQAFSEVYPQTVFICTDYYVDLQSCAQTDVLWDICSPEIPRILQHGFDSIVCQATMEHVWAPDVAMKNLCGLLNVQGRFYLHTHAPCFPYHAWPRDYLRYWPDWFVDLEHHIPGMHLLELLCVAGHVFAVYEKEHV
jgi:hypothetical protein